MVVRKTAKAGDDVNGIFQAAAEIQAFFETRRWRFAIIGGLAVLRWGEPFATQDVDASLLCGFGNERPYVDVAHKF